MRLTAYELHERREEISTLEHIGALREASFPAHFRIRHQYQSWPCLNLPLSKYGIGYRWHVLLSLGANTAVV